MSSSNSNSNLTDDGVAVARFVLVLVVSSWNVFDGIWEAVLWMAVVLGKFGSRWNQSCGSVFNCTWINTRGDCHQEEQNDLLGDTKKLNFSVVRDQVSIKRNGATLTIGYLCRSRKYLSELPLLPWDRETWFISIFFTQFVGIPSPLLTHLKRLWCCQSDRK